MNDNKNALLESEEAEDQSEEFDFDELERQLEEGLEDEARRLWPLRHLNALNTVGYKELFDYFEGKTDYAEAVRLIKRNSRRYARKQLSWFRRDDDIRWFHPDDYEGIVEAIRLMKIG
mgnify:CR=1 FL=1